MRGRGGTTDFYVVASLLALVGFLILIWFVVRIGISDDASVKACHLSVLTRATAPEAGKQFVPLHCTTEKVCLKEGKGTCEVSFAGEDVREIKVDKRIDDTGNREVARTVEKTLAEEMYSCWTMMGKGKLDLFQSLDQKVGISPVKSTCVICSRVALDVASEREAQILNHIDLPTYLKSYKIPGEDMTYLQAFTDPSVQAYAKISEDVLSEDIPDDALVEFSSRTPEYAVVFMQVKPVDFNEALKNIALGSTVAGGSFLVTPIPFKKTILRKAGRGLLRVPGLGFLTAGAGAGIGTAYVWSNTRESRLAAAGYCGEVTTPSGNVKSKATGADLNKGCSMVQVVPYDATAINKICNYIESAS